MVLEARVHWFGVDSELKLDRDVGIEGEVTRSHVQVYTPRGGQRGKGSVEGLSRRREEELRRPFELTSQLGIAKD